MEICCAILSLSLSLSLSLFLSFWYRVRIVSSESYHWTHWIADTCPLLGMCPNPDVSSDNFHWTQALPFGILYLWPNVQQQQQLPEEMKQKNKEGRGYEG